MESQLSTITYLKGLEMHYKVVESFTSIQGEGIHMGRPATFIRLFGCNLKCPFCDEPKHTQNDLVKNLTAEAIAELVETKLVVITGGEPSINDINPLIWFLQDEGYEVQVETNGFSFLNVEDADTVTLSPKKYTPRPKGFWTEVKLLVSAIDYDRVETEIEYWKGQGVTVSLQPINGLNTINPESMRVAIRLAIKHDVRLSPQLHKLVGAE